MISRRRFLAAGTAASFLGPAALRRLSAKEPGSDLPRPLPRQLVWQDCEVGAIFHFDMPLFAEGGWGPGKAIRKTWDPKIYNPEKLDTDQWIAVAKAMGARYAVFTATHFNGFLQWRSDLYPYGVKQAAWRNGKGDVVGDFVASCRKAGIKPGLYMSCFRNAYWKVDRYRVNYGKGGPRQAEFARTCEKMFEELCTRYGELVQIWFDAGNISPEEGGPDLVPIADRYQPDMVFYHSPERSEHRWIGNERGYAGYPCWATMPGKPGDPVSHNVKAWKKCLAHGDPEGGIWSPGMVDTTLRHHFWVWRADTEHRVVPLEKLVKYYYQSVGRNANLVLGVVVDPTGLVPEPDARRAEEFGREIRRRFRKPVAETKGRGGAVTLEFREPDAIDHVVIMEDIRLGERVRKYLVEGLRPDGEWKPVCEGISIGHKRIQQVKPITVKKLCLHLTEYKAEPVIRSFAAYRAG